MKKILLASVAGAGLLASCGGVTVTLPDYFSGTPSPTLRLTGLTNYTTNWRLSENVTDQNGRTLTADTYIICDNKNTTIYADVAYTGGPLSKLGLQLNGQSGQFAPYNVSTPFIYTGGATSGTIQTEFNIGQEVAPLSLGAQAIVVNPVNRVDIKGYTFLRVQGQDNVGRSSNTLTSPNSIPVVDCL